MGSARAPRVSPSHGETGHPATACRAGRIRPGRAGGCAVRAASPLGPRAPHRYSPQTPPRPGAGQGGIAGRRSNRHPAAAPEPAGRTGNGSPEGHHPPGRGAREPGGATPHPRTPLGFPPKALPPSRHRGRLHGDGKGGT